MTLEQNIIFKIHLKGYPKLAGPKGALQTLVYSILLSKDKILVLHLVWGERCFQFDIVPVFFECKYLYKLKSEFL